MRTVLLSIILSGAAFAQSISRPIPPVATTVTPAAVTGARICTITSSSSTAYVGATSPAMATYPTGVEVRFTANQTSGASPTLNCGGGALPIRDALASAAIPTGWLENGYTYTVRSNGTYWLLQEPSVGASGRAFIGNLGIGTTGPGAKLDVYTADGGLQLAAGSSPNIGANIYYSGGWKYGMNGYGTLLTVGNTADGNIHFYTAPSGTAGGAAMLTDRVTILNNGNVGIGTTFATGAPAQKLTVAGKITSYDPSTLGADKMGSGGTFASTCASWTLGTNWACGTSKATHTPGNTAALSFAPTIIAGNIYRVVFVTSGRTAGSVTMSIGGVAVAAVSTNATSTFDVQTTTTGALTFTPSSDFDGSIDGSGTAVSVKPSIGGRVEAMTIRHRSILFADLGALTPANGDTLYCSDCTYGARGDAASGSGTGVFLDYVNGAWKNR